MSGHDTPAPPRPDPFISYSSNAEDVILHRLFGNQTDGFYVDVGAAQPTFDNDTRALYDQGWRGINIEPNPIFFPELARERTRDRNLQVALSDEEGTLDYWEVAGTGLSTCDADEAARARAKGHKVSQTSIICTTLAQVLEDADATAIDLLKVDVEGFELRVLQGNDWTRYRPSVVLVEVTFPETPNRRPDRLRPFLEQNGYDFVYFDGLNDFYVERSFVFPADAFRPPNVFDRAIPFATKDLQGHAAALEHERAVQAEYVTSLRAHIASIEQERDGQTMRIADLQNEARIAGSVKAQAESLERERDEQRVRIETLQEAAEQARARLDTLERQAVRARAASARMEHQARAVEARVARSREQAVQTLDEARRLGEHLTAAQRALERAALTEAGLHASVADHVAALRETKHEALRDTEELHRLLMATRLSTSWRVTRPLRGLSRLLRRVLR